MIKRLTKLWTKSLGIVLLGILALVVALGPFVALGYHFATHYQDPIFGIWINRDDHLSFDEAWQLFVRMDRLTQKIEAADLSPPARSGDLLYWTREVLPMFEYEGTVTRTAEPMQIVWINYLEGRRHNHVGGQSNCTTWVVMNGRYINQYSTWHERASWIATLTHELGHLQQGPIICDLYSSEILETSNQLQTWEVLAGLANQGNDLATVGLLYEVRSVALRAAESIDPDRFEVAYSQYYHLDPEQIARHLKSSRYWSAYPDDLAYILSAYSRHPLNLVFQFRFSQEITGLALNNKTKSLVMDDFYYWLAHAEELTNQILNG